LLLAIHNRLEFLFADWNHNVNFACKGLGKFQILQHVLYRGLTFHLALKNYYTRLLPAIRSFKVRSFLVGRRKVF